MGHSDNIETILIILSFSIWYTWHLLHKTSCLKLDMYDFSMLSSVSIIPLSFVVFPTFWQSISDILGIGFPFILLFGMMIAIIFIFIHRLTVRLHHMSHKYTLLIQEVSLLKKKPSLIRTEHEINSCE